MKNVGSLGEQRLRTSSDDDGRTPGDRFLDHLARGIGDALFRRRHRRREGCRNHFAATQGERVGEAFSQRRCALVDGLNRGRRPVQSPGNAVDEVVVEQAPAECFRDATGDFTAA